MPASAAPMTTTAIDALLERLVAHWHEVEPAHAETGLAGKICDLHKFNFQLWHEEDIARSPDVTDAKIAQVKRAIDKYNQARNDSIEKVSSAWHFASACPTTSPMHSTRNPRRHSFDTSNTYSASPLLTE